MPLQIAAIANSRTPKWIFFPCGVFSAEKLESFQFCIVGRCKIRTAAEHGRKYFTSLLSTVPEQDRVAVFCFRTRKCYHRYKVLPAILRSSSGAARHRVPGNDAHILQSSIVGIFTLAIICRKVGKIVINLGRHSERFIIPTDGFFPFGNILFAQKVNREKRHFPCLGVPCAMFVLTMMSEGFLFSFFALSRASAISVMFSPSSTLITCQP